MKRMILSVIALCAFAQISHASEFDYSENEEISAPRRPGFDDRRGGDDRRDDDRRGNNGPSRPGNPGNPGNGGPNNPGPGNPGGPGHGGPNNPPQPPHNPQPRIEYVTCESQGNRYNTCYVDPYGIRNFYLAKQRSSTRCEQNRNFGLTGSYVWVDKGCRGVFAIERY